MTLRPHLCVLIRWLLRRPEPPPGTGQRYQDVEQAAAQQRLLDQAARLRTHGTHGPTLDMPTDRRNGHGAGELR
ncbi:hypothetical protein Q3V37_05715 [Micromonospora profundi]|uniref:Uncharacterized protein n=1 Tax=Micromonospora profundi TaxID=1420889 RepID=A0AAJ6HYT9_9ACTN|nr:hypothetical protein [Micromonospora profundi]WLS46764.1 hypothetical protein Q3V37_05715 [Micromonospora profundi]